jgi:hypothetical protein
MYLEYLRLGGGRTVTVKLHDADCPPESLASHETVVAPTANVVPDAIVQAVETGARPFDVCGASYETMTGFPSAESMLIGGGHVIASRPPAGGGGGAIGDFEHAGNAASAATMTILRVSI